MTSTTGFVLNVSALQKYGSRCVLCGKFRAYGLPSFQFCMPVNYASIFLYFSPEVRSSHRVLCQADSIKICGGKKGVIISSTLSLFVHFKGK